MWITFWDEAQTNNERLELDGAVTVKDLKETLEALFGVPSNQLVLIKNGQELATSSDATLQGLGLQEDDQVIVVNDKRSPPQSQQPAQAQTSQPTSAISPIGNGPVFWQGMGALDVLEQNKNPVHIVDILQRPENSHLLLELGFHNEKLRDIIRKPRTQAIKELQKFLILNNAKMAMQSMARQSKEKEMKDRLVRNKDDPEAKAYFAEIERKKLVQAQYYSVMNDYPESLTRVLMLYIDCEVNGKKVQAFVDSGAQTSVMSLDCAKRLEIDNLIDERFATKIVGVGSGQSLGRIHLAPLNIKNNFFPMSLTVMGGEKGLGDKNMEFLLGLDMLKRHRCSIDLVKGVLRFQGVNGQFVETDFLHEKDLPESKGGTKGFSPNKKQ